MWTLELGSTTLQLESSFDFDSSETCYDIDPNGDFPLHLPYEIYQTSSDTCYEGVFTVTDNLSQFNSNNETYIDIETNTSDNTRVVNGENLYCYNSLTRSYIEEG